MRRDVRLYNVLFPAWLLILWPSWLWLVLLPSNFLIDSLVLLIAMAALGYAGKGAVWRSAILPIWLLGFAADLIGCVLVFGMWLLLSQLAPELNVFTIPGGQLVALPGVLGAGGLIYLFNRYVSFQRTELSSAEIHRLSLALAVFTAPYTMLIPVEWLY